MAGTPALKRRNTVTFKIDSLDSNGSENYIEIARAVNKQFGPENIACLQPTGRSSYCLTFKGEHMVKIAKEKNLLYKNRVFEINSVEEPSIIIWISGAPFEMDDIPIKSVLCRYGEVKSINYVKNSADIGGYCNGDRKVEFIMKEAVPNFIKIGGYTLTVRYRGLEKVCRRCGEPGHFLINCPNVVKCANCGIIGHHEEKCFRCKICKLGTHSDNDCPQFLGYNRMNWAESQEEEETDFNERFYSPLPAERSESNSQELAKEPEASSSEKSVQEHQKKCDNKVSSVTSLGGEEVNSEDDEKEIKLSYAKVAKNGRAQALESSSEGESEEASENINPFGKSTTTVRTPPKQGTSSNYSKLQGNNKKIGSGGKANERTDQQEEKSKRKEPSKSSPENESLKEVTATGKSKRTTRQSQDPKRQRVNLSTGP